MDISKQKKIITKESFIVEIVSDSGEGAQKAGQTFASIVAKMGNGVFTVEIIPAEIQPPARSKAGASGIRIRIGSKSITNMGNEADLVVAFNEQVLYSRIDQNAFKEGTIILLENKWKNNSDPEIQRQYADTIADMENRGCIINEISMEEECLKTVSNAKKGKNMWVLGMLSSIFQIDLEKAESQVQHTFRKKSSEIIEQNLKLLRTGYTWATDNYPVQYNVPVTQTSKDLLVMNGNDAIGMGVLAAGIEVCSMYPITPATSATHYLAEIISNSGGVIHQAEDEISAIGFAIGAAYAGKTPVTITSGPGMALKTEFIGLAVMCELPIVIVNVQRGGPSTGLPTKVEQGDLLHALFAHPGDAPKVVIAPANIEECFHYVIKARELAEFYRGPVIVLTDANLATGVAPFPRPVIKDEWFSQPINQEPWEEGKLPFDWDPTTGFSTRAIPGQKNGVHTLTTLAHDENSKVAYDSEINQRACQMRSRKIAAVQQTLTPPEIFGAPEGDLLIIGWGSTKGAIEEAVEEARKEKIQVSSIHLRFLSPLEPGLKEIFQKFKKVMTVETNYSDNLGDPLITEENRRHCQLAYCLRAQTLVDVDSYGVVYGRPLPPKSILEKIKKEIQQLG